MPTFKTIRQTAATGILTEHRLRLMVAQGICPGIRTGNRFLVNVDALVELLDNLSREGVKKCIKTKSPPRWWHSGAGKEGESPEGRQSL